MNIGVSNIATLLENEVAKLVWRVAKHLLRGCGLYPVKERVFADVILLIHNVKVAK